MGPSSTANESKHLLRCAGATGLASEPTKLCSKESRDQGARITSLFERSSARMEVAVTTDVGPAQRFNDDAWCAEQLHKNVTLLAVADGFGRPQGVSAALIVIQSVRDHVRRELRRATVPSRSLTRNDLRELLVGAFAEANDRLLRVGGGSDDYVASGCTCSLVLIVSDEAFVAHIGDSRAYLMRRGELV